MILSIILVISLLLYINAIGRIKASWCNIDLAQKSPCDKTVSVIVVYRNEEEHLSELMERLNGQAYPQKMVEYIFIDDHSDDDSRKIVDNYLPRFNSNVQHLKLEGDNFGKKNGIELGVEKAKHDWILTTDADCSMQRDWVESMSGMKEATFVSGPVMFNNGNTVWGKLVELDFISMIVLGGALIQKGIPVLANGANMFYSKKLFKEVNGYTNNKEVASGDDVFLLEKISSIPESIIRFNKNHKAIVTTKMVQDLKGFFQQRIRWAKKSQYSINTKSNPIILTLIGFYVVLILMLIAALFFETPYLGWTLAAVMSIKILVDMIFFKTVLPFFNKSRLLPYVIIADFLHPIYITIIAIVSSFGTVKWKERKYKNG